MHRSHHYIASLVVVAALAGPMSVLAVPNPAAADVQIRIYDKKHHDYHNWDEGESRRWGIYLKEHHREYHDFRKSNKHEQEQYWEWRHSHPD